MGGSFGGYMANWVAGHTDRFKAHHHPCLAVGAARLPRHDRRRRRWEQEMGDPYVDPSMYEVDSPHRPSPTSDADARDPRRAGRSRADLRGAAPLDGPAPPRRRGRFLYFPDENHWVLKPQNARIWYETVLAFLDRYVLDAEWKRPALL